MSSLAVLMPQSPGVTSQMSKQNWVLSVPWFTCPGFWFSPLEQQEETQSLHTDLDLDGSNTSGLF